MQLNNERRTKLKQLTDVIHIAQMAIRKEMRAEDKAFKKLPPNLRGKAATRKFEKIDFLMDDAQCCAGDAVRLLRRAAI